MAEETRDRIVEAAQHLFFARGYNKTSVAEIIKSVDIAKGTFYHHFSGKEDLLDEIVVRFTHDAMEALQPILDDSTLGAAEKLRTYFTRGFAWKLREKERFYLLLNALYTDENLLLRKKMSERSLALVSPLLAEVVRQGVAEGVFDTPIPDRAGELAMRLSISLSDEMAKLFFRLAEEPAVVEEIETIASDLEYGMERLIGAPAGTILIVDRDDLYGLVESRPETRSRG